MGETSATTADPQALQAEIDSLRGQLEEARGEAELHLLHLQQMQEELEFYFFAHQEQQHVLELHQKEERRAEVLIAALLERIEVTRR